MAFEDVICPKCGVKCKRAELATYRDPVTLEGICEDCSVGGLPAVMKPTLGQVQNSRNSGNRRTDNRGKRSQTT